MVQAELLINMIDRPIDMVINLDVPEEVIISRIAGICLFIHVFFLNCRSLDSRAVGEPNQSIHIAIDSQRGEHTITTIIRLNGQAWTTKQAKNSPSEQTMKR